MFLNVLYELSYQNTLYPMSPSSLGWGTLFNDTISEAQYNQMMYMMFI